MKFLVRYQATINIIDQKNDQIYQKWMELLPFQLALLCLAASAAASGHYGHHGYAVGYAYPLADAVPAAVNGLQVVTAKRDRLFDAQMAVTALVMCGTLTYGSR